MSSSASFELLYELSKQLEDGLIDEDVQDMTEGRSNRHVMNRVITTRGRHRGRGVVVQYADYYSESFDSLSMSGHEVRVIEMFVAQPRVTFEGKCTARGLMGKLARLVGSGGLNGPHPLFDRCWVSQADGGNATCLSNAGFADTLVELAHQDACKRINLQAGGGLAPILQYGQAWSSGAAMHWLNQTVDAAETLD